MSIDVTAPVRQGADLESVQWMNTATADEIRREVAGLSSEARRLREEVTHLLDLTEELATRTAA